MKTVLMKRTVQLLLVLGMGTLAAMQLTGGPNKANAAQGFSNARLNGAYPFIKTEVVAQNGNMYCEEAGTLDFDGIGKVSFSTMNRCTDGTVVTVFPQAGTWGYAVSADGGFAMTNPADPSETLKGKVVLGGKGILVDYTENAADTAKLLFHLVALKQ